ncbi:Sensor histidine kinase LiaS [compost metagenome]
MIFKEAINNVLRYSKAEQIDFTARMSGSLLEIQLKDDGKGFDTSIEKSGRGLNNMRVRAERIKGNLKVTSNTEGTTITLSILL